MDWEAPERELGSFMGTASCECEHTQQRVISAGVKLPHSGSACADNGWRPGAPCIILLPAPSEVTVEWRDTLGRYQFPRHSLQTSPQSLCLVTSPPLRAEGSQPHSSPSKQTTCPESCGMPLSHCLHRVLAAPQDHGLRRDTRQVSCQLPQPGSVNGVSNVLEKLSERQKNVSSSCLPVPCSDPMLYLSCCFFFPPFNKAPPSLSHCKKLGWQTRKNFIFLWKKLR